MCERPGLLLRADTYILHRQIIIRPNLLGIRRSDGDTPTLYITLITEHNTLITEHNTLITEHNTEQSHRDKEHFCQTFHLFHLFFKILIIRFLLSIVTL